MKKEKNKNKSLNFQKYIDTYEKYYSAFTKLYPNKSYDKELFQSQDPQLENMFDIALHSLYSLEVAGESMQEKIDLKISCGELKNFFAPIPPMSIVQFNPFIPCHIPMQSFLRADPMPSNGIQADCLVKTPIFHNPIYEKHFSQIKTVYDVTVFPASIKHLKFEEKSTEPGVTLQSFVIGMKSNENIPFKLKKYTCNEFIFYINERIEKAFLIYDLLVGKTKEIQFILENTQTGEEKKFTLSKENLKPLGFELNQLANGVSPHCPSHISLLKDYLYFQNKFMFFKIELPNEIGEFEWNQLQISISLSENKKQNIHLTSTSFELFCTPVVYLEENSTKIIRLPRTTTDLIVAGKNHNLDGVCFNHAEILSSDFRKITLNSEPSSFLNEDSNDEELICRSYFQNTDFDHSSLSLEISLRPNLIQSKVETLIVDMKSFYSNAPFFEDSNIKYKDIKTKVSTILSPSKRRDIKNISVNSIEKMLTYSLNSFDLRNKEKLENLLNMINYSYNKREDDENSKKRFLNLLDEIEVDYYLDIPKNILKDETNIAKRIDVKVDPLKLKGLSLFLFLNIIKALDIHSSPLNHNLKEVRLNH